MQQVNQEVENTDLITVAKDTGLDEERITSLANSFNPLFEEAKQWVANAKKIVVTSVDQVEEMQNAREARLELKRIRLKVENTRKSMKEDIVRRGKAIDGIANVVKFLIEPTEKYLADQENYVKKIEEERLDKLEQDRLDELNKYNFDVSGLDLRNMPSSAYGIIRDNAKAAYDRMMQEEMERQARIQREEEERIKQQEEERKRIIQEKEEAEAKAAEERKAREEEAKKHEAERLKWEQEQKKIREEQEKRRKAEEERIRKEQEERKRAEEERARIERERIAKEEEEKKKAEEERKKAEEEARRKANAPDREKLLSLAVALDNYELPAMSSDDGKKVMDEIIVKMSDITSLIRRKANNL